MASNGDPKECGKWKKISREFSFPPLHRRLHLSSRERARWGECVVQRKRCLSSIIPLAKQKQKKRAGKRISMRKESCAYVNSFFTLHFSSSSSVSHLRWCISMFVDALHKLFGVFLRDLNEAGGGVGWDGAWESHLEFRTHESINL